MLQIDMREIRATRLPSSLPFAPVISASFAMENLPDDLPYIRDGRITARIGSCFASCGPYRLHAVDPGHEETPTTVALDHARRVAAVYHGLTIHVAPAHRGQKLGAALIAATMLHEGGPRFGDGGIDTGFTPAGFAALALGLEIARDILDETIAQTPA